jgi:hypothetical protein
LSALSPGLRSLLASAASSDEAIHQIATLPALLAEARKALPALKTVASAPAGNEGVKRVVGSRFAVFPQPERSDGEWAMWWADYFDVLEDVPEGALEAGMKVWLRNPANEFMPKPGQLRQLAMQAENPDARAYTRARAADAYKAPPEPSPELAARLAALPLPTMRIMREEPTEADKARVKAWAAEFMASAPAKPVPEIRANHGPTDEHGITPELRGR